MKRSNNSIEPLRTAEDVVPIGDRKARLSERLSNQEHFMAAVQEGLTDVEAGRTTSDEELGRRLDARFGPLSDPK